MLVDLKFLDRFVREILKQAPHDIILVVAAVNVDVYRSAVIAAERDRTDPGFGRIECAHRPSLRRDERKACESTVKQRKVLYLLRRDRSIDLRSGRLYQGSVCGDLNDLGYLSGFDLDIYTQIGANVQLNALDDRFLKLAASALTS